ncbi:MFS transporter [Xenorhabdus sp. 12]|uniref:MFS transporter n=1 Tax=Xenorhabdus santafensis TaxID=2582833 RepID=A0ABU4S885_9GAMM|nr:MFS transporter [Xenorhabdus sp. 12]MDX7986986.1 MFS transporter [Xenorhabdus sp. 12]
MFKKILIINMLFYLPMWMSKILHPIYWESSGHIDLFSYSYIAMAIVGTLTFSYTPLIRKFGLYHCLIIGFIFYAVGLSLRGFPINLSISLISGISAGIGANIITLCSQGFILEAEKNERKKLILHSGNILSISQGVGIFLSGILVFFISFFSENSYQISLIIIALITLAGVFFVPTHIKKEDPEIGKSENNNCSITYYSFVFVNKKSILYCFISMCLLGVVWSIIIPTFPIFLKNAKLPPEMIGLTLSLGVFLGILVKNAYASLTKNNAYHPMLISLSTSVSIYLFYISLKIGSIYLIFSSFILFSIFRTLNSFIIDILKFSMTRKEPTILLLGLIQTFFLLGDVLGGIFMPFIYQNNILLDYPFIFPLLISSGMFFFLIAKKEFNKAT